MNARPARKKILIMAGGTGGHVFPGLAVAEHLRMLGFEVDWLGSRQGMEVELVTRAGIPFHSLPVSGLRGRGLKPWLLLPWNLGRSLWAALAILQRLKPAAVVGFGGFAAGPGGLMAAALGYPLIIHEQNSIAGLTNRYLARLADQVLQAFPDTFAPSVQAQTVGNPVRDDICTLPLPDIRFANRNGCLRILILGGSLGALALNQEVPKAVAETGRVGEFEVWHQAGKKNLATAQDAYQHAGITQAKVVPFIEDMAAAYAWADLVICRAGALTISELSAAGIGAILIPYPHAVDDHQTHNASYLVEAGAAYLLPQDTLNAHNLAVMLNRFSSEQALSMAKAAHKLARPNATAQVALACMYLGGFKTDV